MVPLSEAVVETHVQPGSTHAVREVANEVALRPEVDAVPVPVVRVLEVAPSLVVLGGQHHIWWHDSGGEGIEKERRRVDYVGV